MIFIINYSNIKQLIIVSSKENKCKINCFEKTYSGKWVNIFSNINGFVGKNGISKNKIEGDFKTPAGFFSIDFAFGLKYINLSRFFFRPITPFSYWISSPSSNFYNKWFESDKKLSNKFAEHLSDYKPQYNLALSIGYNKNPTVSGKGSAIFIHCGDSPTSGCIALNEESLETIIHWLDYNKFPFVFIQ